MYNDNSSPTLTGCAFESNTAYSRGGGIYNDYNSYNNSPTLTDTTVCGNTPEQISGYWTDNGGNCIAESCNDANDDGIPDECQCLADINGDGYVGITDLLAVIDVWGCTDCSDVDVNQDGIVNLDDLVIVFNAWGECE